MASSSFKEHIVFTFWTIPGTYLEALNDGTEEILLF